LRNGRGRVKRVETDEEERRGHCIVERIRGLIVKRLKEGTNKE